MDVWNLVDRVFAESAAISADEVVRIDAEDESFALFMNPEAALCASDQRVAVVHIFVAFCAKYPLVFAERTNITIVFANFGDIHAQTVKPKVTIVTLNKKCV